MFGSSHIVAPPNIWLAKILVVFLVAYDLANIGKKSELHWLKSHWHANNWQPSKQRPKFGHDQNIGRASFGLNPNKP
jgi:hypothetical protein